MKLRPSLLFGCFLLVSAPPFQAWQAEPQVKVEREDYDMRKMAAPPRLTDTELRGRRLFVQRCGLCHDPMGAMRAASWLDQETIKALGEARVREIIAIGRSGMPGFQYALEPSQISEVIAFLKVVTRDQRPKRPVK